MANTKPIGVAYSDQDISGADTLYTQGELGYNLAAQTAVTQLTNKGTAVTSNTSSGQITLNNAALNATTTVTFTLNNNRISAKDTLIVTVAGGGTAGAYNAWVSGLAAGSATLALRNITAGPLSEAVVLNYALIHAE